ncbi:antitoxin [Caballeronia sp. LZ032]|uniref:type II toxin-antitoxin system RelB family antitoxin n=1 Tax=Caballeronia sp. LZ032 TaxID=3038565 RepID=UPI00285A9BEB|nr:antitoxin [Caballeronia sp. LZ032]MDR5876820.1 antitoxin [Caballeronia sp. LZ032]
MDGKLDPRISEFESFEDAERYQKWFREEIEASLAEAAPSIPHDEVFAEMDALIVAKRKARHAR